MHDAERARLRRGRVAAARPGGSARRPELRAGDGGPAPRRTGANRARKGIPVRKCVEPRRAGVRNSAGALVQPASGARDSGSPNGVVVPCRPLRIAWSPTCMRGLSHIEARRSSHTPVGADHEASLHPPRASFFAVQRARCLRTISLDSSPLRAAGPPWRRCTPSPQTGPCASRPRPIGPWDCASPPSCTSRAQAAPPTVPPPSAPCAAISPPQVGKRGAQPTLPLPPVLPGTPALFQVCRGARRRRSVLAQAVNLVLLGKHPSPAPSSYSPT